MTRTAAFSSRRSAYLSSLVLLGSITVNVAGAGCASAPPSPTPAPPTTTMVAPVDTAKTISPTTAPPTSFMSIARGALALIEAERALYRVEGSDRFFVRFRVTNLTGYRIGLATDDYGHVVYPNQWSDSDIDHRQSINEGRASFPARGGPIDTPVLEAFRSGKITIVEPGGTKDYYRDFNASTRADVDRKKAHFVIVSLGGEVLVTDGTRVEALDPKPPGEADFAVPSPVQWHTAPAGALVLVDRP